MPQLLLKWRSMHDPLVCPVCEVLDAEAEWRIDADQGMPDVLEWNGRVVWTSAQGSAVHGHRKGVCRCRWDIDFDLADLLEKIRFLHSRIMGTKQTEEVPKL